MSNNTNNDNDEESDDPMGKFLYTLLSIATAIIGYHIHNSIFWAIMDFIFTPLAWIKWLICQEVNLTIIKESFAFFLQ